jgi:hypothetical protein
MGDGEPGYCACCRQFHLLRRVEVPELPLPVDVCQYCEGLGPKGLAWQIAGLNEDGTFGYQDAPPAVRPRRRSRRDPLAESLFAAPDDGGFEGFRPAHRSIGRRARIAWLRLRGQI